VLIIITTVIKLFIAGAVELGNDEVYYWTYALHLQSNYFDHPPIVGWLIRLTTANLLLHSEVFVRLGAVISSAVSTYLIYKAGVEVKNSKAGWYAALLYTASIYGSIIAGTFILPDSPQMIFWLWSILLLLKISKLSPAESKAALFWLLFGVASGLCMMSKIHGVFLWIGVILYTLFSDRRWLRYTWLYIAAAISLLIVSPVIIWNFQNNFISYTYHSNRVSLWGAQIQMDSFIRELAGEIFYNNPINFFILLATIIAAFKGKLHVDKGHTFIILFCSLPLIISLIVISIFKDTLPHWSGPAYSTLIILAAVRLSDLSEIKADRVHILLRSSLAFIAALVAVGIVVINHYPGTMSPAKSGENTGEGDPTLDMYGWEEAGLKIDSVVKADIAHQTVKPETLIVVAKWFPGAHIDFYIASVTGLHTYAVGQLFDLHHYYWLNRYKKGLKNGDDAYYIVPSNFYNKETIEMMQKRCRKVNSPAVITQIRQGKVCRYFYIYKLEGFRME
jgi:hypothetical protein